MSLKLLLGQRRGGGVSWSYLLVFLEAALCCSLQTLLMSFELIICCFSYLKQTLEQFSVQPDGTSQHERLKVKRRYRIVCSADVALPLPLCSVFLYLFYNPDGKETMRKMRKSLRI